MRHVIIARVVGVFMFVAALGGLGVLMPCTGGIGFFRL